MVPKVVTARGITMSGSKWRFWALAVLASFGVFAGAGASAATLDRIRQLHAIRLAYREDAAPFSYKTNSGEPAGYMVELCQAVVKQLSQQLQIPTLSIDYV